MTKSEFSRRDFVSGAAKLGAGAAAFGAVGSLGTKAFAEVTKLPPSVVPGGNPNLFEEVAGTAITSVPKPPPNYQSYLSRPDIAAPGISIKKSSGFNSSYPKYFFMSPRVAPGATLPKGTQQGLMICDTNGHLVWWRRMNSVNSNPFNLQVQTYNGKSVLTWFAGKVSDVGIGSGGYNVSNQTYTQVAKTQAIPPRSGMVDFNSDLHEFVITPQNTALVTAYSKGTVSGQAAMIAHAQEVGIVGVNGGTPKLIWDWDSSAQVGIGSSYIDTKVSSSNPYPDYFHVNSIALWPGTRNYLISSRNTCAVYLVDAKSKDIIWRLGGKYSHFKMGQGAPFWWQHDARPLADGSGVSLFDDASQPNAGKELYSSGKVIKLKNSQATVTQRLFHTDDYISTGSQGNNTLLPNGARIVCFGAEPYVSVYAPGTAFSEPMVLDLRLPAGVDTYRAFLYDWTASPSQSEIGFVVYKNSTTHFTGHASWNGATQVAAWRVHYGPSATNLPYHSTAHNNAGFETQIAMTTSSGPTYFQAIAYNSAGKQIGASRVVAIGEQSFQPPS